MTDIHTFTEVEITPGMLGSSTNSSRRSSSQRLGTPLPSLSNNMETQLSHEDTHSPADPRVDVLTSIPTAEVARPLSHPVRMIAELPTDPEDIIIRSNPLSHSAPASLHPLRHSSSSSFSGSYPAHRSTRSAPGRRSIQRNIVEGVSDQHNERVLQPSRRLALPSAAYVANDPFRPSVSHGIQNFQSSADILTYDDIPVYPVDSLLHQSQPLQPNNYHSLHAPPNSSHYSSTTPAISGTYSVGKVRFRSVQAGFFVNQKPDHRFGSTKTLEPRTEP
ncbi:hypothetical protein BDQ12DRAFT_726560 [Crucibulum laeve]|uniref:Uncharacterized protein n=1 Tax=Crucibulum laeve TaxID=68775 RepID=A0A5C3LP23_9AGAR|nr:hypothetical protein BDQ12DRAFT_726560 [Crucibulum laeve]